MWEELLQGPDSASSGTSDSEGEGRHKVGVAFPPTSSAALSSDDENNMQQGVAGVSLWRFNYIIFYII